jgi:hypothetical protein
VNCSTYNVETKQPLEFVVRCFFDNSPRWRAYSIPRQGGLVHVVGGLVGKFNIGHENSTQPAILLNAYKAFSGTLATESTTTPALMTPQSTKSTSSLAPPGYTKPVPRASWSPKTPSHSRNKTTRPKRVRVSKDTISGSEDESQQAPPNASIFNDDSVETPSTFYDAPSFEDGVLGAGSMEDEVDAVARNTRLTSQKRRRVK